MASVPLIKHKMNTKASPLSGALAFSSCQKQSPESGGAFCIPWTNSLFLAPTTTKRDSKWEWPEATPSLKCNWCPYHPPIICITWERMGILLELARIRSITPQRYLEPLNTDSSPKQMRIIKSGCTKLTRGIRRGWGVACWKCARKILFKFLNLVYTWTVSL